MCKAPRAGLDRRFANFNYYYYYYSAHPVSFLTITRFVKLFEAARSQAFRFQKKTEKSLGNTKIVA